MPRSKNGQRITFRCVKHRNARPTLAAYGASADYLERHGRGLSATQIAMAKEDIVSVFLVSRGLSRYSDGSHCVLYTAATDDVAEAERTHYAVELFFKTNMATTVRGISLYTCTVKGRYLDYTNEPNVRIRKKLVHPTDYTYCQEIAGKALDARIDYLVVPSARKVGGICVPVLKRDACEVERVLAKFDVCWDIEKRQPFIKRKNTKRYVTIDEVYSLID